jgi:hypothetical protein
MADPEVGLVICAVFNGMCEDHADDRRRHRLCDAVYRDLGLA